MALTVPDAAVRAAVAVAEGFGITSTEPVILADGANVVVHLSPAPVVAKVAASTPAVRPDSTAWLQRELDVTAFLAARGAPVVPPSPELPATTHSGHGHVMSFWRYQPPANSGGPPPSADEETIGSMLERSARRAARLPGPAARAGAAAGHPRLPGPPADPAGRRARKAALAAAYARLTAELDPAAPAQPLHGDASAGNLMATGHGWLWHDFEDTCCGPVAWDLAASTASQFKYGPRILAAYGNPVDAGQLAVCERLRRLHLTVWYCLYAERLPELAARAAELVASWPPAEAASASR